MIYNHERKTVSEWRGENMKSPSHCPECKAELVAHMGEHVCWHWAHKAGDFRRTNCPHEESPWHLAMKYAYQKIGWEIEVPIRCGETIYRIDTMNTKTGEMREFVHSLSPHYYMKHINLKKIGYNVVWMLDGTCKKFISCDKHVWKSKFDDSDDGIKNLINYRAFSLHRDLGYNLKIIYDHKMWRGLKTANLWFPINSFGSKSIIERSEFILNEIKNKNYK